jgi:hypothetical protein
MADGDSDVYIWRGEWAPRNVTHVRIDKSVEVIEDRAFEFYEHLVQVETHDRIRKVGRRAFFGSALRNIDLRSVLEIDDMAFCECENLVDVKFGDKLERIGKSALDGCRSLERFKLTSIITVGAGAFVSCKALSSIEFSERLEAIEPGAFRGCGRIRRIMIPLKRDLFPFHRQWQEYNQFKYCDQLTTVDLVGGGGTQQNYCLVTHGELED